MPPITLTPEEKLHAALAHGSVIFSFFGPIGPVIVWLLQRRKSKYVSFHALQAMGYQVFTFWIWILMSIFFPLLFLVLLVPGMFLLEDTQYFDIFPFIFQVVFLIALFGMLGLYMLIGLVGAGFCIAGKDFRYPVLGHWLAKYLNDGNASEAEFSQEREDAWVAAVCHATAAIFMWGIAVPVIVWFTHRARSLRLGFQALQAAAYQGLAIVAYFIGVALYLFLFFAMMAALILGGALTSDAGAEMPDWAGVGFFIVMLLFGLIWLVAMVATPTYYILSGVGSLRTLRGHDFRYPLMGRWIARKMDYVPATQAKDAEE
jgi:uncharacterized Tic20 family protein